MIELFSYPMKNKKPQAAVPAVLLNLIEILLFGLDAVTLVEAIHTSCSIHHLLCSSEEWVAGRADFNLKILRCGLGLDDVAACAMNLAKLVLRMNSVFHKVSSIMHIRWSVYSGQ